MVMNLGEIKGISDKSLLMLKKLQIGTINELLEYYPYRYEVVKIKTLGDCIKSKGTVNVQVSNMPIVTYYNIRSNRLNFDCLYNGKMIKVVIFNRGYLKKKIIPGMYVSVTGTFDNFRNIFTATDINLEMLTKLEIIPVYHLISGLTNKNIRNILSLVLDSDFSLEDYIPDCYLEKYKFMPKKEAVKNVHCPISLEKLKQARLRLIYEEFFLYSFRVNYLKMLKNSSKGIAKKVDYSQIKKFLENLPFSLTDDQISAVKDIFNDMTSESRMSRLILGDVGSGKTVVSLVAMVISYYGGFQSAMLVPTEVLATQHFENLQKLAPNLRFGLLLGSLKQKEKKLLLQRLFDGDIDVLIGTHAMLSENVKFRNLGLVVTDEQHRFGVNQRNIIENKGSMVDVIYMSATPIPRTYALSLYGDMDLSIIKAKPNGRKQIITKVVLESELISALKIVYKELCGGHQVYVVAPLINEEDGKLDDVYALEEKFNTAFKGRYKIGIMHGKLKKEEKSKIMQAFKNNEIKILVSTTVIEVGVDVSNATVMMIYSANLFGLATLHQLRGRVGRNDLTCYCFLVTKVEEERLRVLESSNDGFYISEQDFKMRGGGELFGERQSGTERFKIGDIRTDSKIWLQAYKDAKEYLVNFDNNSYYRKIIETLQLHN